MTGWKFLREEFIPNLKEVFFAVARKAHPYIIADNKTRQSNFEKGGI
jgi:hypothetical protein